MSQHGASLDLKLFFMLYTHQNNFSKCQGLRHAAEEALAACLTEKKSPDLFFEGNTGASE